ncbi:hypothetical protein D3C80_2002830 [compost metagenome]
MQIGEHALNDLAVFIHRIALQIAARRADHIAFLVAVERAGTGIDLRAIVTEGEEAVAIDGQVQRLASGIDVARGE